MKKIVVWGFLTLGMHKSILCAQAKQRARAELTKAQQLINQKEYEQAVQALTNVMVLRQKGKVEYQLAYTILHNIIPTSTRTQQLDLNAKVLVRS